MKPRWASFAAAVGVALLVSPPGTSAPLNRPWAPMPVEEVGQAIAAELRARLPNEPPAPLWDVDIPLAVPAAAGHKLRVSSVCRDRDAGLLRFRLACAEQGACLPFLAYVRIAVPVPAPSCGNEATQSRGPSPTTAAVRPGAQASAVLVIGRLRVTAPVTCLEHGAPGEIIWVRGHEGRVFRARVTGPGAVEAILP